MVSALALLYLLSTPFVAETALQKLETLPAATPSIMMYKPSSYWVAGTYFNAPEYDGNTVGPATAWSASVMPRGLHRLTRKPILTTGGAPLGSNSSEAAQMKDGARKGVPGSG